MTVGPEVASRGGREPHLAVVAVLAWLVGATIARRAGLWVGVGSVALGLGVAVLAIDPLRLRGLLRPTVTGVGIGVAGGVAMGGATYALFPLLAQVWPGLVSETAGLYATFRTLTPPQALLVLVPIVAGEEIVWRGLVQGVLARHLRAPAAVLLSSVGYALAHAPVGSPLLVLVALGCGLAWSTLRAVAGSLVPVIVVHVVWDVTVLLIWPLSSG